MICICAGDNSVGQCPAAKTGRLETFALVPLPEIAGKVAEVRAGAFHVLVLTKDNRLYALGRGRDGQLGNGKTANGAGYVQDLAGVVSFGAGIWHSVALTKDGAVWVWGNNSKSQLCDGATTNRAVPAKVDPLPGTVTGVVAGAHGTAFITSDGGLFVCGDNQSGSLGLDAQATVGRPTKVPIPPLKNAILALGGNDAAFSPDGCSIRMAGYNDNAIITASGNASSRVFVPRASLTLCGPVSATPQPDVVHVAPSGGASGCWTARVEENQSTNAKWAPLREALLTAEDILRKNAAWMAAPEPVRMRPTLAAGPMDESGAQLHVKAVHERKADGTRVWGTGECEVIPQVDRIGGSIAQVSLFFNDDARVHFIGPTGDAPKLTGRVGGFPEYNGLVLITKDGRLPWIPQTLDDKLTVVGAKRENALAEWTKSRANLKPMDQAAMQKSYDALKKSDPAGAEKFLETMKEQAREIERQQREVTPMITAEFEKQVSDYKQYRASFTPEQLKQPAVWADPTGLGRKQLDARIAALQALTPQEQAQVDDLGRQSRDLLRQSQAEAAKKNTDTAAKLSAQANDLAMKVRAIRATHLEKASPLMDDARAQYDLTNLKPGDADHAMSVKPDPKFPDFSTPNRIQSISVLFSFGVDPKNMPMAAWAQKTKDTFDFSALVALLR